MVQLDISNNVTRLSTDYKNYMLSKKKDVCNRLDGVLDDIKKLTNSSEEIQLCRKVKGNLKLEETVKYSQVVNYINRIQELYDMLLIITPEQFLGTINEFSKIINPECVGKKIYKAKDGTATQSVSARVVEAMLYETVREKVFPTYVRNLGIKSCVYCNANFTIADKDGNGYFDLDHWQPKSHYPFLCTSFYNLQPSCPACNRRKSADISNLYFSLWKDPSRKIAPVIKFVLDETSLINYLINGFTAQTLHLNIEAATPEDREVCSNMKRKFHLETLYAEHRDVLEEIVWKCLFYRPSYLEGLRKAFGINLSPDDVLRMVMGVYPSEKDVHKRPLSKMIQDVAKQLNLY